ncbi:MAG: hypothetical protein COU69_04205 [Candidatus Pacebacteria bacterium CG10_big_fil_rev_8_21_14_0_10_56_10]|nr:MAG: hypothetical protein COU69_04205 [Candidatus Pacebacteria bacterium CG10_big_fil_rev_8_21_14_0_10_56_10]
MLDCSQTKLDSGLPVIRVPMSSVESTTVLVLANTGSRYEQPDQHGIAHFFEHLVFKGTAKYPTAQDLAKVVDGIGANFNAFTSKEFTGYYVQAAARHLELALEVVAEMLLAPQLRQDDIDREKGVIIEEMNMYADMPAHHIANLFEQMVYNGTGLGHDVIGEKETVANLTAVDFRAFLDDWYDLGNLQLVIAGDHRRVEDEKLLDVIEQQFGRAPESQRRPAKIDISRHTTARTKGRIFAAERFHLEERRSEQAHFVLGWPAMPRRDERRYALSLLSVIIGGNMSSRLFSEVREKRGLAYYVHSDLDHFHDGGLLGAAAGVDPGRVEEALRVTIGEFLELGEGRQPVTAEELAAAKEYLAGKTVLGLEDSQRVAQYFGMRQLLLDEVESPQRLLKKIKAVKLEELNRLAAELLRPEELRLAVIGPFSDSTPFTQFVQ